MKVQLAKTAGFCFGVDRAVGMVEQQFRRENRSARWAPSSTITL